MTLTITPAVDQPPAIVVTPAPISVTPAPVQPTPIVITDAQEIADLTSDGYTVTKTVAAPPPVVVPPPAATLNFSVTKGWSGTIIDGNGMLDPFWGGSPAPSSIVNAAGDWAGGWTMTQGAAASDGGKCYHMVPKAGQQWPLWLQHPVGFAGQPTTNGICIDFEGYSGLTLDICPDVANMNLSLQLYDVDGPGEYESPNPPKAPADGGLPLVTLPTLPAGVYTTVKLSLASLGLPDSITGATMAAYKFGFQSHGVLGSVDIRNFKPVY